MFKFFLAGSASHQVPEGCGELGTFDGTTYFINYAKLYSFDSNLSTVLRGMWKHDSRCKESDKLLQMVFKKEGLRGRDPFGGLRFAGLCKRAISDEANSWDRVLRSVRERLPGLYTTAAPMINALRNERRSIRRLADALESGGTIDDIVARLRVLAAEDDLGGPSGRMVQRILYENAAAHRLHAP